MNDIHSKVSYLTIIRNFPDTVIKLIEGQKNLIVAHRTRLSKSVKYADLGIKKHVCLGSTDLDNLIR